jgi:hypothetical protein
MKKLKKFPEDFNEACKEIFKENSKYKPTLPIMVRNSTENEPYDLTFEDSTGKVLASCNKETFKSIKKAFQQ